MLRAHCQKLNLLDKMMVSSGVILYILENLPALSFCLDGNGSSRVLSASTTQDSWPGTLLRKLL